MANPLPTSPCPHTYWTQMNDNLEKIAQYYQHQIRCSESLNHEVVALRAEVCDLKGEVANVLDALHSVQDTITSLHDDVTSMTQTIQQKSNDPNQGVYLKLAKFTQEQLDKQLGPVLQGLDRIHTMIENHL